MTIQLFPSGIQISQGGSTPPIFLFKDNILDCVVNEQILACRVRNRVVFRLKDSQQVEAFPGIDLPYMECLRLRHEIMTAMRYFIIS